MSTQKTCEKYGHYCQICEHSIDVSEIKAELQRCKDALKIAEEMLTSISQYSFHDSGTIAGKALAAIQAAKENGK